MFDASRICCVSSGPAFQVLREKCSVWQAIVVPVLARQRNGNSCLHEAKIRSFVLALCHFAFCNAKIERDADRKAVQLATGDRVVSFCCNSLGLAIDVLSPWPHSSWWVRSSSTKPSGTSASQSADLPRRPLPQKDRATRQKCYQGPVKVKQSKEKKTARSRSSQLPLCRSTKEEGGGRKNSLKPKQAEGEGPRLSGKKHRTGPQKLPE